MVAARETKTDLQPRENVKRNVVSRTFNIPCNKIGLYMTDRNIKENKHPREMWLSGKHFCPKC